jgi:starvation-inducible DNA-binding protein
MTDVKSKPTTAKAGARTTRTQNAESGFTASKELTDSLQSVLIDLTELHLQAKQIHWNVVGRNFRDLHRQLDEIIDEARAFSDEVAERLRSLHAMPDGRSETVAATTSLDSIPSGEIDTSKAVDLVTERLDATVATARKVHDTVDEEDPTSADLLHQVIMRLEQFSWMVSAENRTAESRTAANRTAAKS